MTRKLDETDRRLLVELQRDAGQTQRELAERIGLSQNACWRRIKLLQEDGFLLGQTVRINRDALGQGLVVFMMIKTRNHSAQWLQAFRQHVLAIPEVTDFHRIGGEYDYMLKVTTSDMRSYDRIYQILIQSVDLEKVTSYFSMEGIAEGRPIIP